MMLNRRIGLYWLIAVIVAVFAYSAFINLV
jgi:hypothetical protein